MRTGAERLSRAVVAAVLGAAAATVLTATAVWTTAARTGLLLASVDDTTLYRLAIPPIAAELRNSDVAERINTGPLRLTRGDVDEILRARFSPRDVAVKAREVHAHLVRYVRAWPADTIFRISIRRERAVLADAARDRVLERYERLPECGFLDDVQTLGRAGARRLFGGSSGREFLRGLPDCRPPGPVARGVVEGVRDEFRRMRSAEPDSVDVFPDPGEDDLEAYGARIQRVHTLDRALGRHAWAPVLAVGLLLVLAALGGRRSAYLPGGWGLAAGFGVGLLAWTGILHGVDGLPTVLLDAFGADGGDGDEVRRLWLALGRYGVKRALWTAGSVLGAVGALLLVGPVARLASGSESGDSGAG